MIPFTYDMVDLDGIDLAEINGSEVPGIFDKINAAYESDEIAIFYDWYFAGIIIVPSYVTISKYSQTEFLINSLISIKNDDTVSLIGVVPSPTMIELSVTENGTYTPSAEIDGFSKVIVDVPDIPPVLESLSVTENGTYTPEEGVDGFSSVLVNVPAPPPPVNPYPFIEAEYCGRSYSYPSLTGYFIWGTTNETIVSMHHLTPGKYVLFVGEVYSNRYRALIFNGKVFSDFEPYIDTQASSQISIFTADANLTGTSERTNYALRERIFFTVSVDSELVCDWSNNGTLVEPYLFKIIT